VFAKLQVSGQNVPKPLNSKFLITEGIKFHDKELYDSARGYFQQVTRNDSLYGTALYEIALGYYVKKEYDSALIYIRMAVNSKETGIVEQARTLMGSIFDDMKMPDSAIICYQTALKSKPYDSRIFYDMGITYYNMDSLDLSEQCLIQAIKLNPTYYKATFALGRLNEKMNRKIEAMLCYYMANLVNPSTNLTQYTEVYLAGESEIVSLVKEYVPTSPSFEKINEYINSKIAMTAKYKPIFKSSSAYARQGDVLFKYLEYDPKIDNFYMNYYVKIFTLIRDKKFVETAMYAYFSGFNMENVQKWIKSNSSKIQKFHEAIGNEIWRLAARGFVNDANYEEMNYVYYDGKLSEFGKYSDEKNKIKEGVWTTVRKDGSILTIANYKNGKMHGEAQDFTSNGQLEYSIPFINGIKSGIGRGFNENGLLQVEVMFENDKLNGKLTRYFSTGQKLREIDYKNGLENGLVVNYYKNGAVEDSLSWANGKRNGMLYDMYANNQLYVKGRIVNDLYEGEFVYYYPDGQISSQGSYTKNNPTGKWVDYYPNGIVHAVYSYNDKGNLIDTTKRFDANGVLTSSSVYSNNGKNVQTVYYRPDVSVYGKEEYKNDNVVKMESFDKDGKLFGEINISNSGTYVKDYNMFGTISAEGMIKGGKYEDRWVFYGIYGNINQISYYKKGEQDGADTAFFPNGKIKFIENYKGDKLDGYVIQYNQAEKIAAEGYFVNGLQEGYFLFYDHSEKLTHKLYYSNNELDQWQQEFYFNGNLSRELYYNNYILKEIINYDSNGVEYERLIIPDSACKIVEHYPNGKIKSEIRYIGGVSNGLVTHFHANGQKKYSTNKIINKIFGTEEHYNEDGKLEITAEFINNKQYGKVTIIDECERAKYNYFNGQLYDTTKYYNLDNKLTTSVPYMENEKHGLASYYDDNGVLAYQLLYHKGVIIECISPKNNQRISIENGKKITTYYANGTKSAEMSFLNGTRDSELIRYYANGKLFTKCYYVAEGYHGLYQEYYSNGNLKDETNYTYDDKDGVAKTYYPNGKLKEESFYVLGKKHGEQKQYNQQGALIKKTMYYYGEVQGND
jgi:antitoxin component YwqK of YwqJK toxin-antitoxin module